MKHVSNPYRDVINKYHLYLNQPTYQVSNPYRDVINDVIKDEDIVGKAGF